MDLSTYPFKTRPYAHQYTIIENTWARNDYALHLEMGLGKSRIVIDNLAILHAQGKLTHAIVLAPAGVYSNWLLEFDKHLPDTVPLALHLWKRLGTQKEADAFKSIVLDDTDSLRVLIMNIEALSTEKGQKAAEVFNKKIPGPSAIVIDESTAIKNPSARRTKAAIKLGKEADYRRVLSGLPTPNSPLDLYAPFSFLSGANRHLLGYDNYYAFRSRYCIEKTMRMGSQRQFKSVVGYRRLDELQSKVEQNAVRLKKTDCLDLPEKSYLQRSCELTSEQSKLYKSLKKEFLTEYEDQTVSPTIMITRLLRFQQLVTGHITTDDGEVREVPSKRLKCLMELLQEVSGKAVIWTNFRYCIKDITKAIAEEYGNDSVASYFGDTKQADRVEIVERFQDPNSNLRFFVGNPSTAGYGITLTAANLAIYYSRDFRLDNRLQSEDRIHRIGQTKGVSYVDLYTPDTIDERIVSALKSKLDLSAKVLGEKAAKWL